MKEPKLKSYILGFILSLGLTISAYIPVYMHVTSDHDLFGHSILIPAILIIAISQLLVQLVFFLHLGKISKNNLNLIALLTTAMFIFTVVFASIWIMNHLNYNMMAKDMYLHILHDEGFH